MALWVPVLPSFPFLLTLLKLWVHNLLLLKEQPLSCSKRICNKYVPCVKQLLSHWSMPQKNIPAKSIENLLEIRQSHVYCIPQHKAAAQHPVLGMEITAHCTFIYPLLFNISICCLMLYLYCTQGRDHFVCKGHSKGAVLAGISQE